MITLSLYKKATNEFFGIINVPQADAELNNTEEFGYFVGEYLDDKYYVLDGYPTLKLLPSYVVDKTEVLADSIDLVSITGLAVNSKLRMIGPVTTTAILTDSALELTFDLAGDYIIKIESLQYLPWEVTIHAT